MPRPTTNLRRKLGENTLITAAGAQAQTCIVFLAGPYIDPDNRAISDGNPSANLRFELFHRLQEMDCEISLGEYRELIDANKGILGKYNNAAVAELHHAREVADAIVMIVDSPGSFAEIGAFSMNKLICEKMLILSDSRYETSTGYVATGPIQASTTQGAQLQYIDLANIDAAYQICEAFIGDRIQRQLMQRLMLG